MWWPQLDRPNDMVSDHFSAPELVLTGFYLVSLEPPASIPYVDHYIERRGILQPLLPKRRRPRLLARRLLARQPRHLRPRPQLPRLLPPKLPPPRLALLPPASPRHCQHLLVISSSFDGKMVKYDRKGSSGSCAEQEEEGEDAAVFILEAGAKLSNVIIGADQAEGIHCRGTCTLTNVWWEDVCEDAATFLQTGASDVSYVIGGGAFHASDKISTLASSTVLAVTAQRATSATLPSTMSVSVSTPTGETLPSSPTSRPAASPTLMMSAAHTRVSPREASLQKSDVARATAHASTMDPSAPAKLLKHGIRDSVFSLIYMNLRHTIPADNVMPEQDELILNCWVAGTSRKLFFEVRLNANARISELEKEIYKRAEIFLKSTGLFGLSLQRVSVEFDSFLRGKSNDFNPEEFAQSVDLVDSATLLSTHWQSQPLLTTLHVVLKTTTKPFWEEESFHDLQERFLCSPKPFPRSSWHQESPAKKSLEKFNEILRPEIHRFLSKVHSTWSQAPDIDKEKTLLLDDDLKRLLPKRDEAPDPKVADFFRNGYERVLCNPSGYERTKLLFEILCKHWGYYFRVTPGPSGIGAPDIQNLVNTLPRSLSWNGDIFQGETGGLRYPIANKSSRNERILESGLKKLMTARDLVFVEFLDVYKEVNGGEVDERAKFDWLLFQILPNVRINGMDPFSALVEFFLDDVDYEMVDHLDASTPIFKDLPNLNSRYPRFLYVLDEAQDADGRYMGAFSDPDGYFPEPVLSALARFLTNGNGIGTIIAGSEISEKTLKYTRRPK
ncbi:15984_t:CDS:10, partial [Acaulospora colombiana]